MERTQALCLLRAVGASSLQVMILLLLESLLLVALGTVLGILVALVGGPLLETAIKPLLPMAPSGSLMQIGLIRFAQCAVAAALGALVAACYPAWRAGRLPPALAAKAE